MNDDIELESVVADGYLMKTLDNLSAQQMNIQRTEYMQDMITFERRFAKSSSSLTRNLQVTTNLLKSIGIEFKELNDALRYLHAVIVLNYGLISLYAIYRRIREQEISTNSIMAAMETTIAAAAQQYELIAFATMITVSALAGFGISRWTGGTVVVNDYKKSLLIDSSTPAGRREIKRLVAGVYG